MAGPIDKQTVLITTLAEYQSRFWLLVARDLMAAGREVLLLAYDDRSSEMLERAGIPVVNMYRSGLAGPAKVDDRDALDAQLQHYEIEDGNLLFSHERVTFAIRDSRLLERRFMIYANAIEKVLDRLQAQGREAVLIQELGGFLSVISCYHGARRRGIDNWFIEPSFFRGRFFLVRNSFAAFQAMTTPADDVSADVRAYLDETCRKQAIVVPLKDRHHYNSALSKVLNTGNIRRLGEKLYDQFLLGKHQEFGYNLQHAAAHARMAANAMAMRRHYRPLPEQKPFLYYPLHVPADMALTLRSPQFLDQPSLIDYLLRIIPRTHKLVIKEHPAQIGAIAAARFRQLLRRHDNLIILPPTTNNFSVLSRAAAIVSVNSKSGAEALLLGRPVVVLGDAFYSSCPLVIKAEAPGAIAPAIRQALATRSIDRGEAARYFETVWSKSHAGELYAEDRHQLALFVDSLRNFLASRAADSATGKASLCISE